MPSVLLVPALVLAAAGTTATDPGTALESWGSGLPIDPRVTAEIQRFERELPAGYALALASALRDRMLELALARTRTALAGEREEFVEVNFPDPGFLGPEPESDTAREFEEGFLFTEFLAFVAPGDRSARDVMRIYTAPEFRQTVSSRIGAITDDDGLSCVETTGVKALLPPTLACNLLTELHTAGLSSQHSQVVANPGGDDFQVVYFKESLKTFVELPDGMAVHYVHFTRPKKLGRLKKFVGKGKIRSSQEKAIELLRARLDGTAPE